MFLGSPGVALEDAERGRRDAVTVRFSGTSSPPHPALQSGRRPYWGLCQLCLMGHLGGLGGRYLQKYRSIGSNLSPVLGDRDWTQRESWIHKAPEQRVLTPGLFLPPRIRKEPRDTVGGPQVLPLHILTFLIGLLSCIIQKQRVTSLSEICKSSTDLSTPSRHTAVS